MNARTLLAPSLLALLAVAGCQQSSQPRASAAATTACRAEVDRVYSAQNRVDLSTRDQRDTPFAAGYLSGITSNGLGARYSRDNQLSSCLANSSAPAAASDAGAPGIGPTFVPNGTAR